MDNLVSGFCFLVTGCCVPFLLRQSGSHRKENGDDGRLTASKSSTRPSTRRYPARRGCLAQVESPTRQSDLSVLVFLRVVSGYRHLIVV